MISVIIITHNEEKNIARCLKSVQWADEIVVVDSGSTDHTVEIAKSLNATVISNQWEGYAKQKEFALTIVSNEWIFSIDADEEVTNDLKDEILQTIHLPHTLNGYEIPRKSFFLGRWIKNGGWYPGLQLRLFKKSKTKMNHRPVHEGFLVEGLMGILNADINHYTYNSLHQYIEKMNDYSSLDVMNKIGSGRIIRWYHFILNPLSVFLRMFVSLHGYRDGTHGFLLAFYSALHSLSIYSKSWEYQTAQQRGVEMPPVTAETISAFKRQS